MGVALTLFVLSLLLGWIALRLRRRTGIPWVPVVASDMEGWQPAQRPLFAPRYALTGKPDYLLVVDGRYVPVEVKPERHAPRPYESDLMQLVAYCVLIEETMGQAPPYGLLRYADTTFRILYTPTVRATLLSTLDTMRSYLYASDCDRSHQIPQRCAGCGFVQICDQALEKEGVQLRCF